MLDFIGGRHRIASVKRQMNALPISLGSVGKPASPADPSDTPTNMPLHGHKDGQREDAMLAAMAGAGCVDEHDAVFRAEQGWQVLLLEAGIIFHSYVTARRGLLG